MRAVLALTLYTVVTGLAVHLSFNFVARRLAAWSGRGPLGWRSTAAPFVAHTIVIAAVVVVATSAQYWVLRAIYPSLQSPLDVIWRGGVVALSYVAIASFIGRLQRVAVAERLKAEIERTAALEARLAVLQAQMQPHFLFNSLNVCAGLIHTQPDVAEATLDKLSGFLRYALESTTRKLVPLDEELRAVRAYLDVQKERFGPRLKYAISVPEDDVQLWVPPMLLQPLVENAILHGSSDEQGGTIRITVGRDGDHWTIDVQDSGSHADGPRHRGTATGQKNVAERLQLVFGDRASLALGPARDGGYLARIRISQTADRRSPISQTADRGAESAPPGEGPCAS